MDRSFNYYAVLGLTNNVSLTDIKRAYRKLAKIYHPDIASNDKSKTIHFNDFMSVLNEAYAVLSDSVKRTEYDQFILRNPSPVRYANNYLNEEKYREYYLKQILLKARNKCRTIILKYNKELNLLSFDLYDEELISNFEKYVTELENTLIYSSNLMSSFPCPHSLEPSALMMRQSIAQASDALDEIKRFSLNYDYNHLLMAKNLFSISLNLTKESLLLIKTT